MSVPLVASDAAIRVGAGGGGRSYAGAYQQVAMMNQIAADAAPAPTEQELIDALPVRVANIDIAKAILRDDAHMSVNFSSLQRCASIFPRGSFAWDAPNTGAFSSGRPEGQCVAEIRMYKVYGNDDILLATANVAAGDEIRCNISDFPESGMIKENVENTLFPADRAPTRDDVKRTMSAENKQNAALKTAAGALIGGAGMYFAGGKDWGNAAKGAAIGGGATYASTQIGKQAGDTLMAVTINAAAGGVIGNMSGIGGSVLMVKDCPQSTTGKCLFGMIRPGAALQECSPGVKPDTYINFETGGTYTCCPPNTIGTTCQIKSLVGYYIPQKGGKYWWSRENMLSDPTYREYMDDNLRRCMENYKLTEWTGSNCGEGQELYMVMNASEARAAIPAALINWQEKAFGTTANDWDKFIRSARENASDSGKLTSADLHVRDANGVGAPIGQSGLSQLKTATLADFHPMFLEASDGPIIDLSNKARLKATTTGAAVGGALGGFAAYQGAGDEIDERWYTAIREYEGSLSMIYCITGNELLGNYNDLMFIPEMR